MYDVSLCDSKRWGISRLFKKFTVKKLVPVIFAVDRNRAGVMLRMSCARRDASRDRIGGAGILTNDGRGCGGRDKF